MPLARSSVIRRDGEEIVRTPLLVPAFSSKGFPDVRAAYKIAMELLDIPILVSAYDLHHGHVPRPEDYDPMVFIDSGGYEVRRDFDVHEFAAADHAAKEWNRDLHRDLLLGWPRSEYAVPTVAVSYDHPREACAIEKQIDLALALFAELPGIITDFLVKPETPGRRYVYAKDVARVATRLRDFDIVGVTEKELGGSVLNRMAELARIREVLDAEDVRAPIHVFGSLDPLETPLYFLAGAEVFDGLTWLRYACVEGRAVSTKHYGMLTSGLGPRQSDLSVKHHALLDNVAALKQLEGAMEQFISKREVGLLGPHRDFLEQTYESLCAKLGREP